MADLDFLLGAWPNYYPGLQALVEYGVAGGKPHEFLPVECYFWHARAFVPDDVQVVLYHAFYLWKKGDTVGAKAAYEQAVAIDSSSPDAHYNLGLLYVELGDFGRATEHAQIAYAAGYPLPGLRNRLQRAGHPLPPGRP
jgi:tetratricopeptide (TPR) repeat protein